MDTQRDVRQLDFILDGHDCPLGFYPSVVIPVGRVGRQRVALFSFGDGQAFEIVSSDKQYVQHVGSTAEMLSDFNATRHGLFALNNREVLIYELGREGEFYGKILNSSIAFQIDAFYRLSLSFETGVLSLIRQHFDICKRQLARNCPEAIPSWVTALVADHSVVSQFDLERRPRQKGRSETESYSAVAATHATLETGPNPKLLILQKMVSRRMNRESAGAAVAGLTNLPRGRRSVQIAKAIQSSLGPYFNSGNGPLAGSEIPSATTVERQSGLSLPFLEFNNVVLNRPAATNFLALAGSGFSQSFIRQDVLTTYRYHWTFARPVVKIRNRALFTYAEVLRLSGYSGGVSTHLLQSS